MDDKLTVVGNQSVHPEALPLLKEYKEWIKNGEFDSELGLDSKGVASQYVKVSVVV